MPHYVLKILVDIEARDDLEARHQAATMIGQTQGRLSGVREIVLHANADHKSIKLNDDGSFQGQWNRGGPAAPPGPVQP